MRSKISSAWNRIDPQGLKPAFLGTPSARLKPCPDTNPGFSARCEAVPSQELLVRIRCGRDLKSAAAQSSGGVAAPIPNFAEAFADSVFEESYFVAGVFEFVDIGPDFGLP